MSKWKELFIYMKTFFSFLKFWNTFKYILSDIFCDSILNISFYINALIKILICIFVNFFHDKIKTIDLKKNEFLILERKDRFHLKKSRGT